MPLTVLWVCLDKGLWELRAPKHVRESDWKACWDEAHLRPKGISSSQHVIYQLTAGGLPASYSKKNPELSESKRFCLDCDKYLSLSPKQLSCLISFLSSTWPHSLTASFPPNSLFIQGMVTYSLAAISRDVEQSYSLGDSEGHGAITQIIEE